VRRCFARWLIGLGLVAVCLGLSPALPSFGASSGVTTTSSPGTTVPTSTTSSVPSATTTTVPATTTEAPAVVSIADNQTGAYLLMVIGGTCGMVVGSLLVGRKSD
jgi:hypothetical protein